MSQKNFDDLRELLVFLFTTLSNKEALHLIDKVDKDLQHINIDNEQIKKNFLSFIMKLRNDYVCVQMAEKMTVMAKRLNEDEADRFALQSQEGNYVDLLPILAQIILSYPLYKTHGLSIEQAIHKYPLPFFQIVFEQFCST